MKSFWCLNAPRWILMKPKRSLVHLPLKLSLSLGIQLTSIKYLLYSIRRVLVLTRRINTVNQHTLIKGAKEIILFNALVKWCHIMYITFTSTVVMHCSPFLVVWIILRVVKFSILLINMRYALSYFLWLFVCPYTQMHYLLSTVFTIITSK
jgi:hypothetical protein